MQLTTREGVAALLVTLVTAAIVGFSTGGCLPSSIRWDKFQVPQMPARSADLRVAVVPDTQAEFEVSDYELELLAADLRATGVFAGVEIGQSDEAELLAVTRLVGTGPACANPLIPTMMTFGLLPVTLPRGVFYDFDFASASGENTVPFSLGYSTDEKIGLIAVPMRLSRNWSKSTYDGTPRQFIDAMRADLLSRYDQLEVLASTGSTRDRSAP